MKQPIANSLQQHIASYIGRQLRDIFGKGPESVFVSIGGSYLTVYLRSFLTPSEKALLEHGQEMTVRRTREKLMPLLLSPLTEWLEHTTGFRPGEIYYDWNLPEGSGMLVLKNSRSFEGFPEPNGTFKGRDGLVREVVRVSHQVEKAPEDLETYEINGRTLLFVRKGVLVQVENELIRLGQGEFLKEVKRSLEKRLLERLKGYDPGMNKRIAEVFVDWSFELDKSVILMILRSHSETAGPDL